MSKPVTSDAHATTPELLARCAEDYAAAETQRHAGDQPPLHPDLTALVAESVQAALNSNSAA